MSGNEARYRVDRTYFPVVMVRGIGGREPPEEILRLFRDLGDLLGGSQPFVNVTEIFGLDGFRTELIGPAVEFLRKHGPARKNVVVAEAIVCPAPTFRFVLSTIALGVPMLNLRAFATGAEAATWLRSEAARAKLPAVPESAWRAVASLGVPPESSR